MPRPRLGRGPGRPKGSPNKTTAILKEAVLRAAELEGGPEGVVGYLRKLARQNQSAFGALLGKVFPLQLQGDADNPINIHVSWKRPSKT